MFLQLTSLQRRVLTTTRKLSVRVIFGRATTRCGTARYHLRHLRHTKALLSGQLCHLYPYYLFFRVAVILHVHPLTKCMYKYCRELSVSSIYVIFASNQIPSGSSPMPCEGTTYLFLHANSKPKSPFLDHSLWLQSVPGAAGTR